MSLSRRAIALALFAPLSLSAFAEQPAWVLRSNAITHEVMAVHARYNPEQVASFGEEEFDTALVDLKPDVYERKRADCLALIAQLQVQKSAEKDIKVRQDLDILIGAVQDFIDTDRVNHDYLLQYINVPEIVFGGLDELLEARNKPERKARALLKLKRYIGAEPGYTPLADLAKTRMQESVARTGLAGPYIEDIKQQLGNIDILLNGIKDDFTRADIQGWQAPYAVLVQQMHAYGDWAQKTIVPLARAKAAPPEPVYANNLHTSGVRISPDELILRAGADYQEVQGQMQAVAARLAEQRHWAASDYRSVIRELKKQQLSDSEMLPTYEWTLKQIEAIIRREHLITLPVRDAHIRLATEAESASVGSPFMNPPRLIGNTGEYGEFVITTANPHARSDQKMDDDTYRAAAWTLTAHEARPGHELQFSSMVEQGVSLPRAIYADNSATTEGWAVYCEAMIEPYMPLDAQLISLQSRLLRVARAILDPMINTGRISPARAKQVLMDDVVISEPFAQSEIDRYAFNSPGQATAYYYGYSNLRSLLTQVEVVLGDKFDLRAFNDFIVAQGLLPPAVLRDAVLSVFVPGEVARGR